MKVIKLFDKYLQMDAKITLSNDREGILYTGEMGNAPHRTWTQREVLSLDMGQEDDIIINVGECLI